jgi:hypothetical protein
VNHGYAAALTYFGEPHSIVQYPLTTAYELYLALKPSD